MMYIMFIDLDFFSPLSKHSLASLYGVRSKQGDDSEMST